MSKGPCDLLTITLNGKPRTLPGGTNLLELLRQLQLDPTRVAVEHNGSIVTHERFATTALTDGDRLEIIQFVGGG